MVRSEGRKPYNILKSTQLGSVKQDQFSKIQKGTFIEQERSVQKNWGELTEIKKAQLATKTFGYGLPGPHSFTVQVTNADSTQTILQPSADEVYMIDALSVKETAASTAGAYLSITDGSNEAIIWVDSTIAANQIDVVNWGGDLYLTNDCYLKLTVVSGALQIGVAFSKVVY